MFILRLCCVFTDEQSEGGELDLDGIDDQEIDKVSSSINHNCIDPS